MLFPILCSCVAGIEDASPITNVTFGQATKYIIESITSKSAGANCLIWVSEGVQCGGKVCLTARPHPLSATRTMHSWIFGFQGHRIFVCPACTISLLTGERDMGGLAQGDGKTLVIVQTNKVAETRCGPSLHEALGLLGWRACEEHCPSRISLLKMCGFRAAHAPATAAWMCSGTARAACTPSTAASALTRTTGSAGPGPPLCLQSRLAAGKTTQRQPTMPRPRQSGDEAMKPKAATSDKT